MPIARGILVAGTAAHCWSSAAGMLRFLARLSGQHAIHLLFVGQYVFDVDGCNASIIFRFDGKKLHAAHTRGAATGKN